MTQLARIAHEAAVMLRPGPEVQVMASPVLLWRVLTNLVDNAVRAAGRPAGWNSPWVCWQNRHHGPCSRCRTTVPASVMGLLEPPRSAWAW